KENKQLIIPFDKKTFMQGMVIMPVMIIAIQFLLYIVPDINVSFFSLESFIELFILLLIRSFLHFSTGLFTLTAVYAIFCIFQNNPTAILDENGIWINHSGFIYWNDIDEIALYPLDYGDKNLIGIMVKDPRRISKQSDWEGKLNLFWAKIFGYYHIRISHMSANEKILSFASQYIKIKE
ncbi:MAG: hypothetical protein V1646_01825, partial [bacterium]